MVLVIDDDASLARGMVRLLKSHGLPADSVYSGEQALEWMADRKPLVLILDFNMPDMSGLDVLREVRRDPRLADVRVLFHSADEQADRGAAAVMGAEAWYAKGPNSLATILAHVKKIVS